MNAPPSEEALAEILGPQTRVARAVDVYESDGTTLWQASIPVVDGSVNVDSERDEWRSFDLTINNESGDFASNPDGFWYDKIIKPYRGVRFADGNTEVWQLGEFMIDQIGDQDFPYTVTVTGRDYAKKLLKDKFSVPTTFTLGQNIGVVIRDIALNGGITKFQLEITTEQLAQDFFFDVGADRWTAMKNMAVAYGYELFFDAQGYLVLRKFRDPKLDPAVWTFQATQDLVGWSRTAKDDNLFNHIAVSGESAAGVSVWAEAENNDSGSPSRIDRIGRRTYPYKSSFVSNTDQAQEVADNFLSILALESWSLSLGSLVLPWLDGGEVVEVLDDRATNGELWRWRLSNFTIPLTLADMDAEARRVEIVL